jgi:hypothetical protein
LLVSCSPGKRPFRMVQFCLAGPQEIGSFTSFMDSIAQDYQMEFTDRSAATEAELTAIPNAKTSVAHPTVNIGADRNGEFSFGAGNLGVPADQIVLGFNGNNADEAKKFADSVVSRLSTRWHIHEVPQGRGAFPLSKCD